MSRYRIEHGHAFIEDAQLYAGWWEDGDFVRDVTEALGDKDLAAKRLVMEFETELARVSTAKTLGTELDTLLERYLAEDYRQFGNTLPQGRAGLAQWFRTVAVHFPGNPPPPVAVVAEGGLVTVVLHLKIPSDAPGGARSSYIITVFRVRDGKIVEHWGGGAP